jgi:hypothetical protein
LRNPPACIRSRDLVWRLQHRTPPCGVRWVGVNRGRSSLVWPELLKILVRPSIHRVLHVIIVGVVYVRKIVVELKLRGRMFPLLAEIISHTLGSLTVTRHCRVEPTFQDLLSDRIYYLETPFWKKRRATRDWRSPDLPEPTERLSSKTLFKWRPYSNEWTWIEVLTAWSPLSSVTYFFTVILFFNRSRVRSHTHRCWWLKLIIFQHSLERFSSLEIWQREVLKKHWDRRPWTYERRKWTVSEKSLNLESSLKSEVRFPSSEETELHVLLERQVVCEREKIECISLLVCYFFNVSKRMFVHYSRNWSVSNLKKVEPQIWEHLYI